MGCAPCGLYAAAIRGAPSCAQLVIRSSGYVRLQLGQRFMEFCASGFYGRINDSNSADTLNPRLSQQIIFILLLSPPVMYFWKSARALRSLGGLRARRRRGR
jgi:hypothetical protein